MNEIEDEDDGEIRNVDGVRLMCLQMAIEYYADSENIHPSFLVNAAEIFRQYIQPPEERVIN